ncbi:MAG: hypothetical protein ABSA03_22925, partial [Streptosporangiaceae bacterium]
LYTTCPALEGLDVTRASQVPSTASGLREAMAAEVGAGQRDRVPEPAVEKAYGIQAVTNRIDDLYDQLAARRTWRTLLRAARLRAARPRRGAGVLRQASGTPAGPVPGSVPASPAPESARDE